MGLSLFVLMVLARVAGAEEEPVFIGDARFAVGLGISDVLWAAVVGGISFAIARRVMWRPEVGTSSGETEQLRQEVANLRRELQVVGANCAAAEQEVERWRQDGRRFATRTVQTQSQVTYTSLRGAVQPRFLPLAEVSEGTWVS